MSVSLRYQTMSAVTEISDNVCCDCDIRQFLWWLVYQTMSSVAKILDNVCGDRDIRQG